MDCHFRLPHWMHGERLTEYPGLTLVLRFFLRVVDFQGFHTARRQTLPSTKNVRCGAAETGIHRDYHAQQPSACNLTSNG